MGPYEVVDVEPTPTDDPDTEAVTVTLTKPLQEPGMNIIEFLEARIAEDEALAQAAIDQHAPEEWESELGSLNLWPEDIAFWAQQTPARTLAECAAKRAILEQAQKASEVEEEFDDYVWAGAGPERVDPGNGDSILFALAAVYKDHRDYQQEWTADAPN